MRIQAAAPIVLLVLVLATAAQGKDLLRVEARDLYRFYQQNELRADGQLKNKRFIVEGVIREIREDFGAPNVVLAAGDGHAVLCRCEKSERKALARMKAGDRVALKGICQGLTLTYVGFHGCSVVK